MSSDDTTLSDFDDWSRHTEWAILVCPQKKIWAVSRVTKDAEVGEHEIDWSKNGDDWIVASLFDESLKEYLEALSILGCQNIDDILSGVGRGFDEAQANLEKWIKKPPE